MKYARLRCRPDRDPHTLLDSPVHGVDEVVVHLAGELAYRGLDERLAELLPCWSRVGLRR
jgi:hypothetical protein